MRRQLPPLAVVLGLGGLVPFLVCGYAAVASDRPHPFASILPPDRAMFALVAYGATILSFLGAVHWGFAIGGRAVPLAAAPVRPGRIETLRLAGGVLPALTGWAALLLAVPARSPLAATIVLACGFALVLGAEHRGRRRASGMPAAYLGLRWVLTAVVLVVLLGVLVMREARLHFGA